MPRKSTASTSIAKETVTIDKATSNTSNNVAQPEPSKTPTRMSRPPSMSLGKAKETTDVSMGGVRDIESGRKVVPPVSSSGNRVNTSKNKGVPPGLDGSGDVPPIEQEKASKVESKSASKRSVMTERPATSSGWLGGWLGRPVVQPSVPKTQLSSSSSVEDRVSAAGDQQQTSLMEDATFEGNKDMSKEPQEEFLQKTSNAPSIESKQPAPSVQKADPHTTTAPSAPASSSWFGLWSKAGSTTEAEQVSEPQIPVPTAAPGEDTVMEDVSQSVAAKPTPGSSWAFWTSENKQVAEPTIKAAETQGELAVVGKPSESKPEPAKTVVSKHDIPSTPKKRNEKPVAKVEDTTPQSNVKAETASIKSVASKAANVVKATPPNLLIPSVRNTYRMLENPSILQQIARLLTKGKQTPTKHLFLSKDTPKIKHALAIGIHGLFPAPLLRTVIGQPTGTSIKFANHAAEAIRRWSDKHGSKDCEIERVALEGEGKIDDRVDNLWRLLLNWIEHVRKADFILIGCHSQGVPVAVMLVAKLIEFGVVSAAKIGICAMAGVSLGPFSDYKSRLFSGSAGELFDFANPESSVSKRYEEALRIVLTYGAKITYCGSIDDQLVSMEVRQDSSPAS